MKKLLMVSVFVVCGTAYAALPTITVAGDVGYKVIPPNCLDLKDAAQRVDVTTVRGLIQTGIDMYQLELMTQANMNEVNRVQDLLHNRAPDLQKYTFTTCAKNNWMDLPSVIKKGVETNFNF